MAKYSKITEPPRTVKEAIDWLIRIGSYDVEWPVIVTSDIVKSINALVKGGSSGGNGNGDVTVQNFNDLIRALAAFIGWKKEENQNKKWTAELKTNGIAKNGGGYTSAYKSYSIGNYDTLWVSCVMRKQKPNGTKSCCTPPCKKCTQNNQQECDDDGCCERCPKRICAKIFIAIIPCLYGVVKFLKEMCQGSNGAWKDDKLDGDSELSKFFGYLGYDKEQLQESVDGNKIHGLLNGSNDLEKKLKDVYDEIKKKYNEKNGTASTDSKTIRSMLQWLARMPATTTISQLKNGIDTKCQSLNNSPVLDKDSVKSSLFATCAMSTFFLMGIERPDNMNKDTYFKELYVSELRSSESHPIPFTGR